MRLVVALAAAALVSAPAAGATMLRALVIPATGGPEPQPAAQVEEAFREADAFYRRSSFGAFGIEAELTPPIRNFMIPQACFSGGSGPGLGAFAAAAKAAAAERGFDLAGYDRFVYVYPERVCGFSGLGVGRDVLLASGSVSPLGIVHELGHTLGLPHASGSVCAPSPAECQRVEYGDPFSVMGGGGLDFSAREKVQLGWIADVPRVRVPGRYAVGTPQEPGELPQALVVDAGPGELWIEDVRTPEPRLVVRLVRASDLPAGPLAHTIYLASGASTVAVRGVLRVRRSGSELRLDWNDNAGPTKPQLFAVPKPRRGSTTVVVWRPAGDAGSGVAGYRIRLDGRLLETTEQTIATLPSLRRGRHLLTVAAIDRAGNIGRPSRARLVVR
jgi:hypothetical protein